MFNYKFDDTGVYIGNLSNMGSKYGVSQYRFALNYELVGKELLVSDGSISHSIKFKNTKYAEFDGSEYDYEALKLEASTYFVRIGYYVAVLDYSQGLVTVICGKDYFYGKMDGTTVAAGIGHLDAGDKMLGTSVAWYLGCERYVWHEFREEGMCRVRWSPKPALKNDLPCKALVVKYPIFLVDITGYGPFRTDAPAVLERSVFLQDYDHMLTVGCLFGGGETPIMVSGYAKFMDSIVEEAQSVTNEISSKAPDIPGF